MRLLVLHGIVVASAEKDCLSSAFDLDRDGIVSRLDLEYFLRREKFLSSETSGKRTYYPSEKMDDEQL